MKRRDFVAHVSRAAVLPLVARVRRRELIRLAGAMSAWPLTARAQQTGVGRVVLLSALAHDDPREQAQLDVFRHGLRDLGWIEGQNLRIETLWNAASPDHAKTYVAEIAGNPPDVVVAGTLQVFLAMRRSARAIPMVFVNLPDPVVMGFVENLAKPDGNFTGFTAYEFVTAAKWLEVLKELAPNVSRVAMILAKWTQPVGDDFYRAMQTAAGSLKVETAAIRIGEAADLRAGIDAFALQLNGGLILAADAGLGYRALVIDLAARHKLPALYPIPQAVREGRFAFYGIDFLDLYRGAASYVDRVMRGTKPADLPIQAPTKFQLAINLKTARELRLSRFRNRCSRSPTR